MGCGLVIYSKFSKKKWVKLLFLEVLLQALLQVLLQVLLSMKGGCNEKIENE